MVDLGGYIIILMNHNGKIKLYGEHLKINIIWKLIENFLIIAYLKYIPKYIPTYVHWILFTKY